MEQNKQKILIADDSEINRSILTDMLGDEYEILEAENGVEAISVMQKLSGELSLLLLDIVMPEMDGFGVLTAMNQNHWIEDIPVIMISAENRSSHVERAYELGVTDFISRPFDALVVHRRVVNTILLYTKQKKLINLVAYQIYEKEQRSTLMIDILSHIVEFRNGESGMHVVHVRTLTELLLQELSRLTDRYDISQKDISLIGTASALHDIGKIAIPEEVLNKPGKLTDEEFAVMKTHSTIGAAMLENLPFHQDEPLVRTAYQICRWHHERWDGRGYPDGLVGDAIPISAQIVALADVYDALTSKRVYKPAFSHEAAVQMILEGKCGSFNPLLLDCLRNCADTLSEKLDSAGQEQRGQREMRNVVMEMQQHEELAASERTLQLLEHERMKYTFFAALTQEIQFEYTLQPPMLTLSPWGAEKLGLAETVADPFHNETVLSIMDPDNLHELADFLHSSTPANPVISYDFRMNCGGGEIRWFRIIARAIWSSDDQPRYTGTIGKAFDIHESRTRLDNLEQMASHDALTGLLNHASAKIRIQERIQSRPEDKCALAILDLDHFKQANDTYGHMFGDEVLKFMADRLRQSIRTGDIVARVGGDEFLIFLSYKTDPDAVLQRVYENLAGGSYKDFNISVSMGVVTNETVGDDYDTLFHAADQALYSVKRGGRGRFAFYQGGTEKPLSMISPIESEGASANGFIRTEEGTK